MQVSNRNRFYTKMCLFESEEEGVWQPKGVDFHNLSSDFWTVSLHLTQRTVRTAKELYIWYRNCITLFKSFRFVFFSEMYYLNWVPMGHIILYVQYVVIIVILV